MSLSDNQNMPIIISTEFDKLQKENEKLCIEIKELKNDKEIFNAYVQLNECNAHVNYNFKKEYRKYFKLKKYDHAPNIKEIMYSPPIESEDKEFYDFWEYFTTLYPKSDDNDFIQIYYDISKDRANNDVHENAENMTSDEFDNLIKIIFYKQYNNDKRLYNNYRDWIFSFSIY
jgi:hypothetical protein